MVIWRWLSIYVLLGVVIISLQTACPRKPQDKTAPSLTILGGATLTIDCGTPYVDAGATANDNVDGNLTASIQVAGVDDVNPANLGEYRITYTVTDAAGNTATRTRVVAVADLTAPVLTLVGEASLILECGAAFSDAGALVEENCEDQHRGDAVLGEGALDLSSPGTYTLTYAKTDNSGNTSAPLSRTIEIQDTTPPVLNLIGGADMTLECGTAFTDPGFTATDSCEGDLASAVVVGGDTVNSAVPGVYTLTYDVADQSGNDAPQLTRTVTVTDSTPPLITLTGEAVITVDCGTAFVDPGATAEDACGGGVNVTSNASEIVNTAVAGEYTVTYNATDAGSRTATLTRTVRVEGPNCAPEVPVIDALPTGTTDSTVTVAGSASPGTTMEVSSPAQVFEQEVGEAGDFSIEVPLRLNRLNRLFARGVSPLGVVGPNVPIEITNDTQPPELFIDFPPDGSVLTNEAVVVAGRVSDLLSGYRGLQVEVNGSPAEVVIGIGTNGTFERTAVPLELGANTITAIATDELGNTVTRDITLTRVPLTGPQMAILDGNLQTARIYQELAAPLRVQVLKEDGSPFPGKLVTFSVIRSDGRVMPADRSELPAAMQQILTDENGEAAVLYRLGGDAGCGNNRLAVTSTDIAGTLFFCASALPGVADQINIGSGNLQRAAADGVAPEDLRAWVSDACNGVGDIPVTFTVVQGGGLVNGASEVVVPTSATGHASVQLTLGAAPGNNVVEANFDGNPGLPAIFTVVGVEQRAESVTSFVGLVQNNSSLPIGGARCLLQVGGEADVTFTDEFGRFSFSDIGSGPANFYIDGATATTLNGDPVPQGSFPALLYEPVLVPNAENSLGVPVLFPALNPNNARTYDGTQDVELTVEGMEGLRMLVRAGSMRRADGSTPSPSDPAILSLNQVHFDDVPMPMPDGASPPFAWTLQPAGSRFDPPVEVQYPNMSGLPAGAIAYFLSFNHATGKFEIVASGSVSADAMSITSDPGAGITTAGWGCNCPPYSVTADCESNCTTTCTNIGTLSGGTALALFQSGELYGLGGPTVCKGEIMRFAVTSPVQDSGGQKVVVCRNSSGAETSRTTVDIPAATPTYTWVITKGGSQVASGTGLDASYTPTETGDYTCTFTATVDRECPPAEKTLDVSTTVVEIEKLQYDRAGTWTDVPAAGFTDICIGSSIRFKAIATPTGAAFPSGKPVWGGAATGTGEIVTVAFPTEGAKTVSAECGNSKSTTVAVDPENTAKTITWPAADMSQEDTVGSSTTNEKPFEVVYRACADIANNVWRLRVDTITGGVRMVIRTGGSRNAITNPPADEAEAVDAVTTMKAYYNNGRGSWHTAAATIAHEGHHYTEWQCSSEHFWPATETAMENLTVPYTSYATEAEALAQLRTMANGADTKNVNFKAASRVYWFTLSDATGSRPYAAGQLTLNEAIQSVQALAATNGWTVPQGVNTPSAANPCYQAYQAYNP